MIYFRTPLATPDLVPAELAGWEPPRPEVALNTVQHGDHRIVGICGQWDVGVPQGPWQAHTPGWQVCKIRDIEPLDYVRLKSPWPCITVEIDGKPWFLPAIVDANGKRLFKVAYGGSDFLPVLTPEQERVEAIVHAVRGGDADMSVKARWAANLLGLTYHLSPATIGLCGFLSEDLIETTLAVAVGYGQGA